MRRSFNDSSNPPGHPLGPYMEAAARVTSLAGLQHITRPRDSIRGLFSSTSTVKQNAHPGSVLSGCQMWRR